MSGLLRRSLDWLWPWRWFGVLIVVGWGWVMVQLMQHKALGGATKLEKLFPWAVHKPLLTGTSWMGIYLKGKKIGYSRTSTTPLPAGYAITQRSLMRMALFGRQQEIKLLSRVEVNRRYQLKRFSYRLNSGLSLFRAVGAVKGKQLEITLYTGGAERVLTIPYKPALLASVLRPYIASQKPPPGQRITAWMFDPQSLSYTRVLVVVERYEEIVWQGKRVRALRMRQELRGMTLLAWLDAKGRVLKEFSPAGMTLMRETAMQAPRGIQGSFDVIRATRIRPQGKRLLAPTTRQQLQVRLDKVPLSSFPALRGLRQRLRGRYLTVRKQPWPGHWKGWPKVRMAGYQSSVTPPVSRWQSTKKQRWQTPLRRPEHPHGQADLLARALRATPLVQSQHFLIQAKAHQITAKTTHRLAAIKALMTWFADNVKERSVLGVPSALETLKHRIGDCNEHATLFAALARSLQIPCTITSGLVYRKGSFYFHAWNECHIQGPHWVSVDVLWRQLPADATHIAFTRGGMKEQARLLQLLGKLRVTVIR